MRKILTLTFCACLAASLVYAQDKPAPQVQIPQPGVPQIMTIQGTFVRAAYNNEGYAILGYKFANQQVGKEWMLLELGMTVRDGVKNYEMPREALSIETPDGKTIAMATQSDYQKTPELRALDRQAATMRDSINYFPPMAAKPCRIGYFADQSNPTKSWDVVELSNTRACLGRVYFQVPGGIQYGQHWLNVKFRDSLIRVPFRILTKEEEKMLDKNYKSIEKQVKEAFAPKKK